MGILTKEEIDEIYDYALSPTRFVAVPFYPVMKKGNDKIVIDKSKEQRIMYYLKMEEYNILIIGGIYGYYNFKKYGKCRKN